jgi:hypothetical protein
MLSKRCLVLSNDPPGDGSESFKIFQVGADAIEKISIRITDCIVSFETVV